MIYGTQGVGKTLLCFLATIRCLKHGFKTIYISTERLFAVERIIQLIKDSDVNIKGLLENLIVITPNNFDEQTLLIKKLEFFISPNVRLIVFDNITDEYLNSLTSKKTTILANKALNEQMAMLKYISKKKNIPIIVTGHLIESSAINKKGDVVASKVIRYWCDNIIRLEKKGEKRMLVLEKFCKNNVEYKKEVMIYFRITTRGIVYDNDTEFN